jgi:hypothetical protein
MKPRVVLLLFLILALLSGGIAYWMLRTTHPSQNDGIAKVAPPTNSIEDVKPESEEEKTRRMLLGVWKDDYQGKRTMTLNEDGSGTMLVELSGVQAFLFASKLRFEMTWLLDGQKLTKKTVGGEPADKVNLILNTMGDTAEDTLLEVTDDRLLLLDKDGTTKYDWRRVTQHEPSKE